MDLRAIPEAVLLVTLAIDVQLRYLATLLMGWTPTLEAWVLAWESVEGDPRDPATLEGYVAALGAVRYPRAGGGELPIHLVGIDSGYATDCVYRAVRAAPGRAGQWVFATKGIGGRFGDPIVLPIRDVRDAHGRRGLRPLPINTDGAKTELMACLKIATAGRGYWHIPKRVGAGFIRQLTAEEERTKLDREGMPVGTEWKKRSDVRNEGMDCAVISLALAHRVTPAQWFHLLTDRHGPEAGLAEFRALYPGVPVQPAAPPARRTEPWIPSRPGWLKAGR